MFSRRLKNRIQLVPEWLVFFALENLDF